MPWTRKQVKLLLSKASPLTASQQDAMQAELHAAPALGHARKGSAALKRTSSARLALKRPRKRNG
jgi:hypothetical protein